MRRLFLTISLTTIALGMLAQNITVMPTDSTVTVPADRTNPEFKGGQKALTIFLTKNLRYPDAAADYSVEGSVIMTFVVGEDGSSRLSVSTRPSSHRKPKAVKRN